MKLIGNYINFTKEYEIALASLIGLNITLSDVALDVFGSRVPGCFAIYSENDKISEEENRFFEAEIALSNLYQVWIEEKGLSRVGLPMLLIPGENLSDSFREKGTLEEIFEIDSIAKEWILKYANDPCDENNPYVHYMRGEKIFTK